MRNVLGLVKLQKEDSPLGQVRSVLEGKRGAAGQGPLSEAEAAICLLDDQCLVWYELEQRTILVRRTSDLPIPRILVPDLLA